MRAIIPSFLLISTLMLSACQSSSPQKGQALAVTFCDRLIAWQPVGGDATGEKRAITRPEVCALAATDGVWMRVGQVHSSRGGAYWLLMPRSDEHLTVPAEGGTPVLAGWQLQVRPLSYAHEIYVVPAPDAVGGVAATPGTCPRKAIGKKDGQRYCVQ